MKTKLIISLIFVLLLSAFAYPQEDEFEAERKQAWKTFSKKGWEKFDFTKKKLTKTQLAKLSSDGVVDELALLRGIVFGKRGREFKERSIQNFLKTQTWYKPKPTMSFLFWKRNDNASAIIELKFPASGAKNIRKHL